MAGITAPAFDGMLNSNEIYNALFNIRILFQKFAPQTVKRDPIVGMVDKATGMYGDTGIIQGMDIQGTYDFTMDAEAPKLLSINRNKTQKTEKFVINKWRQTDVTNDAYISKRAFLDEGSFSIFNTYIVGTLPMAKNAFETGFVKASIGTYTVPTLACNISVPLPAKDETEATERRRASLIKKVILNLKADMSDSQRKYNGYNFYSSYRWDDFSVIFSTEYINDINAQALYSAFNPRYIEQATDSTQWTPKWFGNILTTPGSTLANNSTIYSLVEINSDASRNFPLTDIQLSDGVYRIFPGDLLPNSFAYLANQAYTVDPSVICILFDPEYVYYMQGYQQGEAFYNPRSATTNHYLRWGHSDVTMSKFKPFMILRETLLNS